MIEIVFGDSACGSLKMAQNCGKGQYLGGATSVVVCHADGSAPTKEEIYAAQQQAKKQMKARWEAATPMGGNPADVFGFSYGLSVGDISENLPGEKRQHVLSWLYEIYPDFNELSRFTEKMIQKGIDDLYKVCGRMSAGESVRIWYSNQPDELCGLYWFMAQISHLPLQDGQVILVTLPDYELDANEVIIHSGWGEMEPEQWHRYTALQKNAPLAFCKWCAHQWKCLQEENAPLRAVLNGQLVSVSETIYDSFIMREITAQENEFSEAMLIGTVLGKYHLGIGDAWIAQRIESMIVNGDLIPVTQPASDSPIYHRKLKKAGKYLD